MLPFCRTVEDFHLGYLYSKNAEMCHNICQTLDKSSQNNTFTMAFQHDITMLDVLHV